MTRLAIVLCVIFAVSGCANPKAANAQNFTAALNGYFDSQHGACVKTNAYPMQLVDPNGTTPGYAPSWALNKVGLLTLKMTTQTVNAFFYIQKQHTYTFGLSRKAKPYWHADADAFCLANLHVSNIDNFTEPVASSQLGAVMTQVKYTYYLDNVAPWARNVYVRKYVPGVDGWLTGDRRAVLTARLVLTEKGWQVWNQDDVLGASGS